MRKVIVCVLMLIVCWAVFCVQSCRNTPVKEEKPDSLAIREAYASSPVLTAAESLQKMHIEKGFAISIVAEEPLVNSPVAMVFDEKGRIWVAEMENYMPDTAGNGEEMRTGKIVILTDKNGDGVMDERKIFLDSLVLPRALCLVENGILVAESPNLWFYEIKDDKPVTKTLVNSTYAEGGSVEHQPNGLLRALDNWIYSAKSAKRYRKKDNHWLIENTHFRGQWGITQDDYGRLYYNTNSENLLGDLFSPGFGAANQHQQAEAGFNESIVPDNRVYAARPNTGVNRGYMEGVLNDSLRLVNFTAACGPLIYGSHIAGNEYYGNAFVAEPAANLVKRNILNDNGYRTAGKQASTNHEFLASEDERFRPVNLYNGPDGALYVVDMYRGILQHKAFLTGYLKNEIKERALTRPTSCGRIYKIVPLNYQQKSLSLFNDTAALLPLLGNENNWVRNKAQQLIVDGKFLQVSAALRSRLSKTGKPLEVIHSLWTLEGLGTLRSADVLPLLKQDVWPIRMQALSVLPSVLNKQNVLLFMPVLQQMLQANDTLAAPYIAFLAGSIKSFDPPAADKLLLDLVHRFPDNVYVADAIISNLYNREKDFYKKVLSVMPDTTAVINRQLRMVIDDISKTAVNQNIKKLEKEYTKGVALFQSVCQPCHGSTGNGVRALGPPLNNSNWVTGDKDKLMSIVLFGLTGPIKVGPKVYSAPEVSGEMPAVGQNKDFTNEDIAQVLSFIRNSWNNKATKINADEVKKMRNNQNRQKPFTMEELNKLK